MSQAGISGIAQRASQLRNSGSGRLTSPYHTPREREGARSLSFRNHLAKLAFIMNNLSPIYEGVERSSCFDSVYFIIKSSAVEKRGKEGKR